MNHIEMRSRRHESPDVFGNPAATIRYELPIYKATSGHINPQCYGICINGTWFVPANDEQAVILDGRWSDAK